MDGKIWISKCLPIAAVLHDCGSIMILRALVLAEIGHVDEALDGFDWVSKHLDDWGVEDILLQDLIDTLDALSGIIAACSRHPISKAQKKRLARAQSLHHLYSTKRDALTAAERESQSSS